MEASKEYNCNMEKDDCTITCIMYKIFKIFTFAVCLTAFLWNSFVIINEFVEDKTIISSDIIEKDLLQLPTIVICNASAYKSKEIKSFSLENYLNNTIKLTDFLVSVRDLGNNDGDAVCINNEKNGIELYTANSNRKPSTFKVESIYSLYRGHCFAFTYNKKVIFHFFYGFNLSSIKIQC